MKARLSELERIIGKQTVQIVILKKILVRPEEASLSGWLKDSGYRRHCDLCRLGMAWGHLVSAAKGRARGRLPSPKIAGEPGPSG